MKKGCFLSGLGILLISSIGLGCYFVQQSRSTKVNYNWNQPSYTDIINKTVATGTIKPRKEIGIKPQVSGVIEKLYVEAGTIVKKGQRLAKIKLVPSQVNINTAQSAVDLARIQLQQAEREWNRQNTIYSRGLDLENAKANLDNALKEANRNAQLYQEGIISEQEYNSSVLEKELKETDFQNAEIASKNILHQYESDVEIKRQQLESAINNLALLQEGASKSSNQIANIVRATVSGMVLDVQVEPGSSVIERNNFNEGTTIAVIADMNALIFEGKVDESDVGKLKIGMELELVVGAVENESFFANLEYIAPKGVDTDGSIKFAIRAAVQKKKQTLLRAGYSANADIILDKKINALTVKERDVIFEEELAFVEIKEADGEAAKVEVELGLSNGIDIEIVNGIDENTLVKVQ